MATETENDIADLVGFRTFLDDQIAAKCGESLEDLVRVWRLDHPNKSSDADTYLRVKAALRACFVMGFDEGRRDRQHVRAPFRFPSRTPPWPPPRPPAVTPAT